MKRADHSLGQIFSNICLVSVLLICRLDLFLVYVPYKVIFYRKKECHAFPIFLPSATFPDLQVFFLVLLGMKNEENKGKLPDKSKILLIKDERNASKKVFQE